MTYRISLVTNITLHKAGTYFTNWTDIITLLNEVYLSIIAVLFFKWSSVGRRRRQWHPLQYSCLENPMDGGAWWAAVHGVAKSRTRLSDFPFTFHFHALVEMAPHSRVLAWRIPGTGSLVGCRLWGRTESDTTEVT